MLQTISYMLECKGAEEFSIDDFNKAIKEFKSLEANSENIQYLEQPNKEPIIDKVIRIFFDKDCVYMEVIYKEDNKPSYIKISSDYYKKQYDDWHFPRNLMVAPENDTPILYDLIIANEEDND